MTLITVDSAIVIIYGSECIYNNDYTAFEKNEKISLCDWVYLYTLHILITISTIIQTSFAQIRKLFLQHQQA